MIARLPTLDYSCTGSWVNCGGYGGELDRYSSASDWITVSVSVIRSPTKTEKGKK